MAASGVEQWRDLAHVFFAVFEHSWNVVPAVVLHGSEYTNWQIVVVDGWPFVCWVYSPISAMLGK